MNKKFIRSTFILLIGGFVTKILGIIIKITMSRMIGSKGLGLYMLILPTFSLFISLGQFGMPTALIKMISSNKSNNKRLMVSVFCVSLLINIFLMGIIFIFADKICMLLHNNSIYLGIISIAFVIPFTSISSLCRSYFFGKEKMLPHVVSNILEDVVRLFVIIIGIPFFIKFGISYLIGFLILVNIISESVSILILFLFLPKNIHFNTTDFKPSRLYISESLSIGIFCTCGRLIGSIGYFLEPIILTNVLVHVGYSSNFITHQYGVLSGYVMPLLLLPSFFTGAISQALFPMISKDYANNKIKSIKMKCIFSISLCLIIGVGCSILFFFFPHIFLRVLYGTNEGINYIKVLVFICLLQYVQSPLSVCLDAVGKSFDVMIASILGVIFRLGSLFIFSFFKIGIWSLIISIGINVFVVTTYLFIRVCYHLK